jgi:hypothetical protein
MGFKDTDYLKTGFSVGFLSTFFIPASILFFSHKKTAARAAVRTERSQLKNNN